MTHKYLLYILQYLEGSIKAKLVYKVNEQLEPIVDFCDALWASGEGWSTTSYVIRVFKNFVCFKSRKQSVAAAEAELIAMSECARDIMWLRKSLRIFFS